MSKTYIAAFVSFIALLAQTFKVELPFKSEEVEQAITVLVGLISFGVILYRRYRQGGITPVGVYDPAKQAAPQASQEDL